MKFALYCALLCAAFAAAELRGAVIVRAAQHANIPASVRSSPGGYRSYHFWHAGFQGGK
ncbi:MAG TPA: hypothetical protein VH083_19275 [Myxococcales bacterium]|jgi:hypothetical protein|nr:hypothetical protein [Myxococcales bacterium]